MYIPLLTHDNKSLLALISVTTIPKAAGYYPPPSETTTKAEAAVISLSSNLDMKPEQLSVAFNLL